MHSRHQNEGPRPNLLVRAFRGLVFLALLPAILVAGLILLPVFAIARLVGLGPRGRGCRGRSRGGAESETNAA
ncbi:MAG: hypothetical protein QOJ47_334 [Gaiellales bacterium]|jgi:hypothetical protein|nr:hypothetical protein [Gaiellales bacterium]